MSAYYEHERLKARMQAAQVGEIQRTVLAMLRLGMAPYVTFAFDGTIALALLTPSAGPNDTIIVTFERIRELTATEAALALGAGAGEFRSHKMAPPSIDEFTDPTG